MDDDAREVVDDARKGRSHGGPPSLKYGTTGRGPFSRLDATVVGPLRVLHVVDSLDPATGGPAVAAVGLAVAQATAIERTDAGGHIGVLVSAYATGGGDESAVTTLRQAGVKVSGEPRPDVRGWRRTVGRVVGVGARRLRARIHAAVADTDVVHIHGVWDEVQYLAARAAMRHGVPFVIRPCGMLDRWSLGRSKWRKWAYRRLRLDRQLLRASAVHFTTQTEADVSLLPEGASRIVEPNGVTLGEFQPPPPSGTFRRKFGVPADVPIVLFLGRLHPKKGVELLIDAFAKVGHPSAVLVVAGPGKEVYRSALRARADLVGLGPRGVFLPMTGGDCKAALLNDADLFALTSYQENFGVAVVEALACGTPVIVSHSVALAETVTKAGVGAAVSLEVPQIARVLSKWLSGTALRKAAAARAVPLVRERFDWPAIADRWLAHYAKLLRT